MRGAEWVRVDFHLHSPGVKSFKLPEGSNLSSKEGKRRIAKEYVDKLKEANIKIGAITDYNGIRKEWFYLIKEEAEKENIKIFPGAEFDILFAGGKYGLHLLVIFEERYDIDGINRFIHSLDKNPQNPLFFPDRTNRHLESRYELSNLIKEIRNKYECLIIFPHPEQDKNGLFRTYNPTQSAKYLEEIYPDGIEYFSDSSKLKLINTGKITKESLKKRAILENSDPKSLEEIGNKKRDGKIRATYLKLSDFSLDAIKLALHDPSIRVAIYSPPKMTHDWITGMKINGSGFLKDISIYFNPEMNTLIGGRGVGKSAIIETIRYGLGLQVYSEPEYRTNFVHDVVGSGGVVEIYIQRYYGDQTKNYVIRRTVGKEVEIYDENNRLNIDVGTLFDGKPLIIIGQKELYHLARDLNFRRKLVDELIGEDIKQKQKEFNKLVEKLKVNANEIISLKKKNSKKDEYEQELKNIEDEIKIFAELGVVEKLKRLTDTIADDELINDGLKKIKDAIDKVQEVIDYLSEELSNLEKRLGKSKTHHESTKRMQKICKKFKEYAINMRATILKEFEKFKGDYENEMKIWREYKNKVESDAEKIKRELGDKRLKPDRLEELTKKKAILKPRIEELKKVEDSLSMKLEERERLKDQLKEKRHELFNIRQKRIEEINKKLMGRLKLEVRFEEDRSELEKRLKNLLAGSRIYKNAINNIVTSDLAIDGLLLSEYVQKGKEKIIEKFGLSETIAEKFIKWFRDEERLFELETLFPEDRIIIKLKVDDDFKEIERLSDGQKATALLLLLFAQEDRILILDQPEEDLDNRFIYEDVVKILRDYKSKRQFIIATHNANIPVIGDSEQIIVLESEGGICKIVDTGSVDKVSIKNHVKNIMEGGEEAFRLRAEKYGGV